MSSEIAIRVTDVKKSFHIYARPQDRLKQTLVPRLQRLVGRSVTTYGREFWALKGINLEILRGQSVGIIGRNGSGKSTLLQIICGTLTPTLGRVDTRGRIAALLELGSGFNPEFTGRENVFLNAAVLGLKQDEIEQKFPLIAAFADIGDFIDQPVKTYSSGMLVRLSFAVIAHVDADILIVDEALAVGDVYFNQKCMNFLRQFRERGTILFVSHDTNSVRSLCDKAVWLQSGELVAQGDPKTVCDQYLESFFESRQGKSASVSRTAKALDAAASQPRKDQRSELFNHSTLRNDIRVFEFDPKARSIGQYGALITRVALEDSEGATYAWVVGGEEVTLRIEVAVRTDLKSPIIGFYVKDRLGQNLFGDNTYISHLGQPVPAGDGDTLTARFRFQMPRLAVGDYSISAAVAEGDQHDHVHHHWIHDALFFRAESSSVASGILGIPMQAIELQRNSSP